MRSGTLALLVASLVVVATAGCSSDTPSSSSAPSSTGVRSDPTTASVSASSGPTLAPGIVPVRAADITEATDVRALITSMGFPAAWPMPDGLTSSAVLGLVAGQTSGESGTDATFSLTWSTPVADLDATAKQWFETANSVLDVGPLIGTSTSGPDAMAGVSYSAGDDDEPSGRLTVTASPVDAASIAVQVEFELVNESPTATLQFSASTIAALPSIAGCVPELVQASLVRYDAPNTSPGQRSYTTIFQGRCASRATFDSTVSWAVGRDGRITQDEDSIEVTDSTGPDGESVHVGAEASGSLRIDTLAVVSDSGS